MNNLEPLRELLPWMKAKVDKGLGDWAQDGNGCYFLDFETLKFYSPFDDELIDESCREFEYVENTTSCYEGDIICKVDGGAVLDESWIESYKSYLAEKELLS